MAASEHLIVSSFGGVESGLDHAYVLMGGGIDSTTLVALFRQNGFRVEGIHFDYGQPAALMEGRAVDAIAGHYGISAEHTRLVPSLSSQGPEFSYRNALLVLSAASRSRAPCVLAIGIHAGTRFYDCSPEFFELARRLVNAYSGGTVRLVAPWLDLSKQQVFDVAKAAGVPISLTYSCQVGDDEACGNCLSCKDRSSLT